MSIFEVLQFGFVQKAFVTGAFVAVLASTLGLFLVLKRLSLIGDGLAHVSFGAVALGLFLGFYPIYFAIPLVVISSLIILRLAKKTRIYSDAAIGVVSSLGIAVGIILASKAGGFNISLFSYLFGNILAINTGEMVISIILSVFVLAMIYIFYYDLFSLTFNEDYAKTSGIKTDVIESLLVMLTAVTVVLAIKVMGVMMVSALLILPAVTALQLAKGFKTTLFVSVAAALVSVFFGILISVALNIPTSATIILTGLTLFVLAILYKKLI